MATAPQSNTDARRWFWWNRLRAIDWMWMGLAIIVPTAGLLLQVTAAGQVAAIGSTGITFPAVCGSRVWLGIDCPLCGVTRSIVFLMHGDLAASWEAHHLGWLVGLMIVGQLPYRLLAAYWQRLGSPTWQRAEAWAWGILGILLLINRMINVLG